MAARIGGPQHGVVARSQLLRAGLQRRAVDHLIAAGTLIPLYRGVYAVGHRPVGPRSRDMAVALLANGPVAWHSAAGLWAVRRPWHGPVHALGTHSWSGPGYVIHRTRHLPPEDVTTHWGIPVTTPLRTLLDLSRSLPLDAMDAALAEALVRKLVTLEDLQPRATGNLKRLLDTAAPTKSMLERDLRRLLRHTACRNRSPTASSRATRSTSIGPSTASSPSWTVTPTTAIGARSRPTASVTRSWSSRAIASCASPTASSPTGKPIPPIGSGVCCSLEGLLEREHLGDGGGGQLAVEVREGLAGRG